MIDRVRRVVMGEPEPGTSAFTHVDEIAPLELERSRAWLVWGWDEPPTLPHHGAEPYVPQSIFPPPRGVRVWALGRAEAEAGLDREPDASDAAAFTRLLSAEPAGMYEDPARPGMHRTDSIDIAVVVSGELTSVADDGSKVVLRAGDVYVQNGAIHNWEWDPENPAHVVWVLVGAERDAASRVRDPLVRRQDATDTH